MQLKDVIQQLISLGTILISIVASIKGVGYGPVAQTTKGKVQGLRVKVHGKEVDIYWGIPYAKPPVGDLRFKHPVPSDPWRGIRNATEKPAACWQGEDDTNPGHKGAAVWNPNTNCSEDCLYLNVWVPTDSSVISKPVMIWIFGGGFYSGSSVLDIYDGRYLAAENNVIVVSMQYRVGALGYLALFHREAPGNAGMFDQVMALDWVQHNIHFFGGNPHSVTLFGESAGAVSVGMHMMSPLSRSKFHRVILQSGAPQAAWATVSDKEAKNRALILAKNFQCNYPETPDIIDCLRRVPANEFHHPEWDTIDYGVVRFPFVPIIDGTFLQEDPEKSLRNGNFKKCPVLLGHNTNEANFWLIYYHELFSLDSEPMVSQSYFDTLIDDIFHYHPYYPKLLNSFGKEAIKFQYRNWLNPYDQKMNAWQIDMAVGDFSFICPCVDFALHAASAGSSVYYYVFEHRSTKHHWPEWSGVLHADEINFMFGEPTNKSFGYTEEEKIFSKKMMRYWTNFAKTGDPNRSPGSLFLDEWPLFDTVTRKHLILRPELINRLNKSLAIGHGSRAKECSFWKDYLPNLVVRTADMSEMEVEWKLQFNEWSTKYIVEWKQQFDSFLLDHGLSKNRNCPTP
ncbi:acetylcholinesterase-like [Mercenaria mercenaria]|uniref:acetylcholinesterase-like n=1 Tax=Mercenaria mercenaria TaxID=6596 RepID=UPI00234F8F36|nr:acetylcholinesterase-like [Mercenaria mercenaria]XP_053403603.1 acetylcholinesterase-like [Mercenaria mercenaria]XP_053403605.1 acetylcholinesterase-like [Mercenaria mercenaria]